MTVLLQGVRRAFGNKHGMTTAEMTKLGGMKMRFKVLFFTASLAILSSALCYARSEVDQVKPVQQQERSLVVEYTNGTKLNYAVKFSGTVHIVRYEDGDPSTLTHPFDDRKCHWTITPTITRQSFVVLPDGEQAEVKDLATVYNVPFTNQGSDFLVLGLRTENCGDAQARFDSDINNGVAAVNRDMSKVVDDGIKTLSEAIKKKQGIVHVTGLQ